MRNLITIFSLSIISLVVMAFTINENPEEKSSDENIYKVVITDDVEGIISNSCYGCHHSDSKNTKGKNKLNFDDLTDGKLSKGKTLAALNEIKEVVEEGNMPPEKFLKKYPDKALSKEDNKLLVNWVNSQAKSILSK